MKKIMFIKMALITSLLAGFSFNATAGEEARNAIKALDNAGIKLGEETPDGRGTPAIKALLCQVKRSQGVMHDLCFVATDLSKPPVRMEGADAQAIVTLLEATVYNAPTENGDYEVVYGKGISKLSCALLPEFFGDLTARSKCLVETSSGMRLFSH